MSTVGESLLLIVMAVASVPVATLLVELVSSLAGRRTTGAAVARGPLVVLIPAHNEEGVIATTLNSIALQLAPHDRVVVVADNCSDGTAAIARSLSVEVVERKDPDRRGKGYALDHGRNYLLQGSAPEAVFVVDADCQLEPGCLASAGTLCAFTQRPVQAAYLMSAPDQAEYGFAKFSMFAWRIKNWARPIGLSNLGLPCMLMGSGMMFPWKLFAVAPLATDNIVEDLQLGLDLAIAGHPPIFCPEAIVRSAFPAKSDARESQRRRWEHGYIASILNYAPKLLLAATKQRSRDIFGMFLELVVPPLALLLLVAVLLLVLSLLFLVVAGWVVPFVWSLIIVGGLVGALLMAWVKYGRDVISLRELFAVPFYAAAKIPLYLQFITQRQKGWIRTGRDSA